MKKLFVLFALMATAVTVWAGNGIETEFRTALVLAYSPVNNVYEDDNIRLEFYDEILWITNKTNRTIYLNMSQCFVNHNRRSYPMMDLTGNEKHEMNKKKDDEKPSIANLSSSVETYQSIAPSTGTKQNPTALHYMSNYIYGHYTTSESPSGEFTEYEERLRTYINEMLNESLAEDPKGKEYKGTVWRHLTEDESVNNLGASIAYSFSKDTENWTPVTLSTWVSDMYIVPYYVEMPPELTKQDKRGFGVKNTEAAVVHLKADSPFEYEEDKSPIIVLDWVGKFKKGKFRLSYTRVSKTKTNFLAFLAAPFTSGASLVLAYRTNFYKSIIHFDGANDDWGKMSYMDSDDLSKFEYKR